MLLLFISGIACLYCQAACRDHYYLFGGMERLLFVGVGAHFGYGVIYRVCQWIMAVLGAHWQIPGHSQQELTYFY